MRPSVRQIPHPSLTAFSPPFYSLDFSPWDGSTATLTRLRPTTRCAPPLGLHAAPARSADRAIVRAGRQRAPQGRALARAHRRRGVVRGAHPRFPPVRCCADPAAGTDRPRRRTRSTARTTAGPRATRRPRSSSRASPARSSTAWSRPRACVLPSCLLRSGRGRADRGRCVSCSSTRSTTSRRSARPRRSTRRSSLRRRSRVGLCRVLEGGSGLETNVQ